MRKWWARSVAAVASVAVVAAVVALAATAVEADRGARDTRGVALVEPAPAPAAAAPPPAPAGPPRVTDDATATSLVVADGWRPVRTQTLVPVAPGRFTTVLGLADRGVVAVGRLDPGLAAAPGPLAAEARRLVAAFADGTVPGAQLATVSDARDTVAGRAAFTAVRRATDGDGSARAERADGALVRVTTVSGPPGGVGVVLLAVVVPGRTQAADATAADRVVRTLRTEPTPG